MPKDTKHLCKRDKEQIKSSFGKLKDLVARPRFVCRKCGRVATDSVYLCKPEEL